MLLKAGVVLLVAAVLRVSASPTYIEPDFVENVKQRELDRANRIVSGWEAIPGQHPHQANLRMVDPTGSVSGCGGSFVARNWLITAAHCTAGRITLVIRGGSPSITTPEYIAETTEWWNYPTFDDSRPLFVQPDDISIVKLQVPVTYTRNLRAIKIQSKADAFRNYENELVHTSGYGRTWTNGALTEVLRWVYLRGISNADCLRVFGATVITDNTICAGPYNVTSQSVCQGDSGGPMVHVGADGVDTLIGVTSFVAGGDFGCHSGLPSGFIRPGPFLSWFEEISGIDFENLNEEDDDATPTPPPGGEDGDEDNDSTPAPPPGGEDGDEDDDGSDGSGDLDDSSESSESDEDDDDDSSSQLLKHLQVKVKVKVSLNKILKAKKKVIKDKKKLIHHKSH